MIGMKTSRAQYSSATAEAVAMTTSATLRSFTSIGAVVSGIGSGARRLSSCTRSGIGICFRGFNREAGAPLQRRVDRHSGLRAFRGGDDRELHVTRRVAD